MINVLSLQKLVEAAAFSGPIQQVRVKCASCGKFMSATEMTDGSAKFHYTPSSEFSDEHCEWTCARCSNVAVEILNDQR